MEAITSFDFWATIVPIAFASLISLAIYIVKYAMPFKNLHGVLWWVLYIFVCFVFLGLFIAVSTGLQVLAGLKSDPAYYWLAMGGIYGYLALVAYVPSAFAINKVLAHRYPLPWEKN